MSHFVVWTSAQTLPRSCSAALSNAGGGIQCQFIERPGCLDFPRKRFRTGVRRMHFRDMRCIFILEVKVFHKTAAHFRHIALWVCPLKLRNGPFERWDVPSF